MNGQELSYYFSLTLFLFEYYQLTTYPLYTRIYRQRFLSEVFHAHLENIIKCDISRNDNNINCILIKP